jgi:hypothetical protein
MESDLRHWNAQHQLLRRLLLKDKDYQRAIPIFLEHHAAVHAAKLHAGAHWSWPDEVLSGLTPEQMRHSPKGSPHSVAWRIWHMARIEDVTMNVLLAGATQVFENGKWPGKMEIDCTGVGNEMSNDGIVRLSKAINLNALFAYRLAVGKRTCAVVKSLKFDDLPQPPARDRLQRLIAEHAVEQSTLWLLDYWGGHPAANLLLMPATRHSFVHLNEIKRMLPKLRRL